MGFHHLSITIENWFPIEAILTQLLRKYKLLLYFLWCRKKIHCIIITVLSVNLINYVIVWGKPTFRPVESVANLAITESRFLGIINVTDGRNILICFYYYWHTVTCLTNSFELFEIKQTSSVCKTSFPCQFKKYILWSSRIFANTRIT